MTKRRDSYTDVTFTGDVFGLRGFSKQVMLLDLSSAVIGSIVGLLLVYLSRSRNFMLQVILNGSWSSIQRLASNI